MLNAIPNQINLDVLNLLVGVSGLLNGAKVHLFQNNINPGPTTVLADFTEATFDGYSASAALVWSPAYYDPLGQPTASAGSVNFASTSPLTVGNTIYGFYVTNGGGTELLFSQLFDSPIGIAAPFQGIEVQANFYALEQPAA